MAVLQAAGLVAAVKAVTAGAADGGSRVDARCQCRCGHRRLEGGARSVQPLTDPVEQRCGAIGGKRGVVGAVGVQVEPRHICRRQNAAGAHIDYYGSPGAAFPSGSGGPGRAQGVDLAEQGILQHFLQCAVYGQYQRGPGACLPQPDGAAHRAVKAGVDQQPPVLPAQQCVVGGLQSALADDGVHGKAALSGGGPLLGSQRAGKAQRMGQQRTVRPAAHTPGRRPHGTALDKTGPVQRSQQGAVRIPGYRQFPRRGGRTKGSKLCFHILAACQFLYGLYGLAQVGAGRGRYAQVDVVYGGIAGQHGTACVQNRAARGVLGDGIAGRAGLGGLVGVMVSHDELHPCQPCKKGGKYRAAQYHQHRNAGAAV